MTKDEYEDFALRYKGCGACFPMYHTLSRFEKMWFSAIQKDVAKLEKEKCELLGIIQGKDKVIQELKKELNKANEWHFVKDGEYPTHSNRVLVFTDEGVGFGIYGLDNKKWYTYDTGFDVIAWKEITLPKEIEE